jgi:hypothetical protein
MAGSAGTFSISLTVYFTSGITAISPVQMIFLQFFKDDKAV